MGYDSQNLIYNMGLMFWYLPLILLLYGLLKMARKLFSRTERGKRLFDFFAKRAYYNLLYRYLLESYVEILICVFLHINASLWVSSGDRLVSFVSLALSIALLAFPYYIMAFLHRHKGRLNEFEEGHGSLFSGMRIESQLALLYNPLFLFRRQLFAATVVFLHDWPMVQVNITFYTSLGMIAYIIHARPFQQAKLNYLEIFNEMTFLALTYPALLFTGYMDASPDFQYNVGWAMILTILLNVAVNFIIILWESVKGGFAKCKQLRQSYLQKRMEKAAKNARGYSKSFSALEKQANDKDQIEELSKTQDALVLGDSHIISMAKRPVKRRLVVKVPLIPGSASQFQDDPNYFNHRPIPRNSQVIIPATITPVTNEIYDAQEVEQVQRAREKLQSFLHTRKNSEQSPNPRSHIRIASFHEIGLNRIINERSHQQ